MWILGLKGLKHLRKVETDIENTNDGTDGQNWR